VTVTNLAEADGPLLVNRTILTGNHPDAFDVAAGQAPFTLAPGESTRIEIAFTPSGKATKKAQLQIISNDENTGQIDVWLTTEQATIVVQSVDQSADEATARGSGMVNVDANQVDSGSDLDINVSQPSAREQAAHVDTLNMTAERGGNFTMNVTYSQQPTESNVPEVETDDGEAVQYVAVDYSVPSSSFQNTSFRFKVAKESLPAGVDPTAVTFRRYQDGWKTLDSQFVRETGSHYVYTVDTPGFSQFVVTAPVSSSDSGSGLVGVLAPVAGVVVLGLLVVVVLWRRRDG
jgi:PGF-pre-PGF domain-containing protein